MSDALMNAGMEASREVCNGILVAAGDALKRHGPDPNSIAILGTGFTLAVIQVDKEISPGFKAFLIKMLEQR